jgi:thiosulfate reductase cytochrome b subunit
MAAGIEPAGLAWLLVAVVGLGLLAAFACLRPLAGQAMLSTSMVALMFAAMVMLMATTAVATRPDWHGAEAWLAAGWLLVYMACGTGLAMSWRRFRARPHPFVQ